MENAKRELALEAAADALLKAAGRDQEYPAYTERALLLKERRAHRRDFLRVQQRGLPQGALLAEIVWQLRRSEIEHMFRTSGLTERERRVCRAAARGETFASVAKSLGCSPQAAHQAMRRARAKLIACWRVSPYRGLWKVYAEDVQRVIWRSPRHSEF